jgi:alanyl-tRNA synthetase
MNSNEIRSRFLKFFEERGHTPVASSSLIPAEDPTLLFINAGMNQFKDVFLGAETRGYSRAVSSQKCVRAGGKHNDLDNVGYTRRHHTFFEMLGNFSFGDYFKKDAIEYAWELLTDEFGLEGDRLWVSVFREDDEAEQLWHKNIGVPMRRIVRLDEKDNFWQMGDTGPCGPCSEIHYDFGPGASEEGHTDCVFPCECGRYVEIWNLVFMQFDRDNQGTLTLLPKPSIDTGMGLERIATILQGKISNFETDLLRSLIDSAGELLGVQYGKSDATDVSLRIIADHVRAATFLIGDGVIPGNEGRGYVLRKIMRRGIRQGTLLGTKEPFLHTLTGHVVELMKGAYPDLVNTHDYVAKIVANEEQRFSATIAVAVAKLDEITDGVRQSGSDVVAGKDIFRLYDTYGLPLDFTREIADEKRLQLDIKGFEEELEKQRVRARESWKGNKPAPEQYNSFVKDGRTDKDSRTNKDSRTKFVGYLTTSARGLVRGILVDGQAAQSVDGPSAEAEVILDQTPFYAESGGQVGDTGILVADSGTAKVLNTYAPMPGLIVHKVQLDQGKLSIGDELDARVDTDRRSRIAANHTGTHLLHGALRDTLGVHVKQAGSLVAPDRLRFDYTHYAALNDTEIADIERSINRTVLENHPVNTEEMELADAVGAGAIAIFGEKYQQNVRVVRVGDVSDVISMELCGGTHTRATGDIGTFKIVSESSVAAGVRRVEALTGMGSYERLEEDERLIEGLSQRLRTSRADLPSTIDRFIEHQKQLEAELEQVKRQRANSQLGELAASRKTVGTISVVSHKVDGVDREMLRELAENVRTQLGSGVVVLGMVSSGKANLVTSVSEDLRSQVHAGKLVKEIAGLVGGSGGGRPDFAQAGGNEPEKLDQALDEVYNIVGDMLA